METKKSHPCERIYAAGANGKIYGDVEGVCRITGKLGRGLVFEKWVRDTFTDVASLKPGTIISNEALFCFDESSEVVQKKAGKEKPQRFRTYSHIIDADGNWHCFTKADKKKILELILAGAQLVCLTDSGQKHLLFKHKNGMWQLDDIYVFPDVIALYQLHKPMMQLVELGFSQTEIITGNYLQYRIMQVGLSTWKELEDQIKNMRGTKFFTFTSWLLFSIKSN